MSDIVKVGVRELARQIGRSHVWVLDKIKAGKIPRDSDGRIPLVEALEAVKKLFQEKAGGAEELSKTLSVNEALKKAQLATQVATAKLRDLEFKQKSGEFVSVADVEADAREVAEKLRAFCIAAPTRYAGLLENRTQREAEAVLRKLFNELLASIHNGRFFRNDFEIDLDEDT